MKIAHFLLILLLAGCSAENRRSLEPGAMEAAAKAEQFVARHGFTTAGHPAGLPVERVSLYDGLFGKEETLAGRKGLLQPRAVCVRRLPEGDYSVMFKSAKEPDEFWFVDIRKNENGWLGHQPLPTLWKDCVLVSAAVPNNSFKPKPLRGSA